MPRVVCHLFGLCICLSVLTTTAFSGDPVRLRLLSYNIHHAEGVDGKLDLKRIAEVIIQSKADIVALQEVDQDVGRSGNVLQARELARLVGMNHVFGGNIKLQSGEYGNAVLTRFEIEKDKNHFLPCLDKGEQRGVLEVHVVVNGIEGSLRILATHFDHRKDDQERVLSAKKIESIMENDQTPSLLLGDINDVLGSRTLNELQIKWQRTNQQELFTIPVDKPTRQIDFIFVRSGQPWRVTDTRVLEEKLASDHRAILSEIEYRSE